MWHNDGLLMADDWVEVHRRNWIYVAFATVYGGFIETVFGLVGLGGMAFYLGNLLPFVGIDIMPGELNVHLARDLLRGSVRDVAYNIGALVFVFAGAAAFAWWGLGGAWACLVDAVCPSVIYQGRVDQISIIEPFYGSAGKRYLKLIAGRKTWSIPDVFAVREQVARGGEIRAKYLRGSGGIIRLWVKR